MTNITSAVPAFHEGEEVVLATGTYQGTQGVFLRLREDTNWADITQRDGVIRSHPVAWLARFRKHTMTDIVTAGSIWMEAQRHLPNSIHLQGERDASGWTALNGARSVFETEVHEAGWTLFFMAGEIRTTVFGFDKQKALGVALQRLITTVKSHNCNGIEISQVNAKSFLKVPYVTVSAHARHLQNGATFSGQTFNNSI